jgi:putative FmdB family regulatory protein
MPLYEYRCDTDGMTLELLRPMSRADDPVTDPEGRGRTFRRVQSTFAAGVGAGVGSAAASGSQSKAGSAGCCPCGKNKGTCGSA